MKTASKASGFLGARAHAEREPRDFYPTPPAAVRALCAVEKFVGEIRDPGCGAGHILATLHECGYRALSGADLHEYRIPDEIAGYPIEFKTDFMTSNRRADNMVMNPPFKLADRFIRRGLTLSRRKLAVLARLQVLEGHDRHRLIYARTPPARVWVFVNRLNFNRGKLAGRDDTGGTVCYGWFVWDVERPAGSTVLGWMHHEQTPASYAAGAERLYVAPSAGPLFDGLTGGDDAE